LALFWALGLATDLAFGFEPSPAFLLIFCLLLVWISLPLMIRARPNFLSLPLQLSTRAIVSSLVVSAVTLYVALALTIFAVGSLVIWLSPAPHPETSILVALAALWLPLWLTPPATSIAVWMRFRSAFEPA
jgi:Kef-type K+ transport system membrane component KefB